MIAFIWQSDWEDAGIALARRLADAGHEVTAFCRNGQKNSRGAGQELPAGLRQAKSLAAAIKGATAVLTLLSTPQEVEDVYLGEGGIFEKAASASLFIDLSTSSPRLAKELHALAAVHDHGFVEAPLEGVVEALCGGAAAADAAGAARAADAARAAEDARAAGAAEDDAGVADVAPAAEDTAPAAPAPFRILAAGESDNLEKALPILRILSPRVVVTGLPGSGMTLKLASQIALAGALMGLVESIVFAGLSGVDKGRILEVVNEGPAASAVARAFGQRIIDEDFVNGLDLRLFFNELTCALDAADELDLALPGLETAHQLYDLLVLVGGARLGIHALALIYYDEERCARYGLNWELAQRAMDVYERASEGYGDDYDYDYGYDDDDEECDDPNCGHHHPHRHHHDEDERPSMGGFFSPN
jgi:3-hydroxyisobutyrate dehydrogenase